MEYRLNSRTYGYLRDSRMGIADQEEYFRVKALNMQQKQIANQEAKDLLQATFATALRNFEGCNSERLIDLLERDVYSLSKMHPYGLMQRAVKVLKDQGVDVDSGVWNQTIVEVKSRISEMTDPNKFYTA